jgi:hypothetical protein
MTLLGLDRRGQARDSELLTKDGVDLDSKNKFITHAHAMVPDYNVSVQTLYTRITRALLQSFGELKFLSHVEMRPTITVIEGLPSWVPYYSVPLVPDPLVNRGPNCNWCAASGLEWKPDTRGMDDRFLEVQGMYAGDVADVSECSFNNPDHYGFWASVCRVALGLLEYYCVSEEL